MASVVETNAAVDIQSPSTTSLEKPVEGYELKPLDEAHLAKKIGSVLISCPPGSGKTIAAMAVLKMNEARLCDTFVISGSSAENWTSIGIPKSRVHESTDPKAMLELLDVFGQYYHESDKKGVCAVVLDDFLYPSRREFSSHQKWLQQFLSRAHRYGILVIVACHNAATDAGYCANMFGTTMHGGVAERWPDLVRECWSRFYTTQFPDFDNFVSMYNTVVKDRGQFLVSYHDSGKQFAYWHPQYPKTITFLPDLITVEMTFKLTSLHLAIDQMVVLHANRYNPKGPCKSFKCADCGSKRVCLE